MRKKIIVLIMICFIARFISIYLFQFVLVQGDSMSPAYKPWQLVIMSKYPSQLKTGDIIVFQCASLDTVLIKRVVACPGDTVQIKNGILYVNGFDTRETFPYGLIEYAGIAETPLILKADEYFVLGDNLEYSKDSRYTDIGCVKKDDILGTVLPKIPISR